MDEYVKCEYKMSNKEHKIQINSKGFMCITGLSDKEIWAVHIITVI